MGNEKKEVENHQFGSWGLNPVDRHIWHAQEGSLQAGLLDCVWTSVPVTQSLPAGPFLLTSLLVFVFPPLSCELVPVVFATLHSWLSFADKVAPFLACISNGAAS